MGRQKHHHTLPMVLRAFALLGCLLIGLPTGAIDISQDFANIKERQYFLRVGLVEETRQISVVPAGEYFIHDQFGSILYRGAPSSSLEISCPNGTPSRRVYYALFATYEPEQLGQAEAMATALRVRTGLAVAMRNDPREMVTPSPTGGLPPRMPRLIVVSGPHDTRSSALRDASAAGSQASASVIEIMEPTTKARIEARDSMGRLVAQAVGYLGIWPKNRDTVIGAYGGPGSGGAGQNCKPNSEYRGLIEAWVNPKGSLTLVNRVFIEHYLYGVLPTEIGGYASLEAKKAQAVISRSAAIAKLRQATRHEGWNFDFCDEVHCQAYGGSHREDLETNRAVDATMGQVCTYHNEIIDAVYSQCCGGITASNEEVWTGRPHPYLRTRTDSEGGSRFTNLATEARAEQWIRSMPNVFCNSNQPGFPTYAQGSFRWTETLSGSALLSKFAAAGKVRGRNLQGLRVTARTESGRVDSLEIRTDAGTFQIDGGLRIRQVLGLKSSLFSISPLGGGSLGAGQFQIQGVGSGHGVGLCQLGAMTMARQGFSYIQILKHYYEGVDIYKIYQ